MGTPIAHTYLFFTKQIENLRKKIFTTFSTHELTFGNVYFILWLLKKNFVRIFSKESKYKWQRQILYELTKHGRLKWPKRVAVVQTLLLWLHVDAIVCVDLIVCVLYVSWRCAPHLIWYCQYVACYVSGFRSITGLIKSNFFKKKTNMKSIGNLYISYILSPQNICEDVTTFKQLEPE